MLQTKDEKFKSDMKEHQNLIFNELSRFVTYFINLSLPYDQANSILQDACEQFMVERSKVHILCTELRQNQRNTQKMFTEVETRICSLQKRSNRLCRFGITNMTLIVGCTIKYIDTDEKLRAVLLLSREMN